MKRIKTFGNKIHFTSLGCARNLVDTEVMLGIALKAGYEVTDVLEDADYLVVNTCGFLSSARQESCDAIDAMFEGKKKGAKVIVAGCMVQKHKDELQAQFPQIHYFLGSGDMEKILDAIQSEDQGEAVTNARSYLEWGEIPRQISTPKNYAYLKIAEGCAKQCAFCIIPKIKGPLRSKPQERVLQEFDALLAQGVHEIILIAQDLGDYGKERKEVKEPAAKLHGSEKSIILASLARMGDAHPLNSDGGLPSRAGEEEMAQEGAKGRFCAPKSFAAGSEGLENLLRAMLTRKGDFWIRLLYLYPDEISDELVEIIASDPRMCPYLDMPIQHINDGMLKAMRRKTSKAQIIHTIALLRKKLPDIVIRTSLMVGFPGETEEQFQELVQFVQEHPLDNIGIFKYSREEESSSAKMPGHISEEVKQQRHEILAAAQHAVVRENNRKYIGKTLKVVIEGYHPDSPYLMRGRFYGQCPEIDGQVIINDGRKVDAFGKCYDVKITDVIEYDLIGKVVAAHGTPKKAKSLGIVS